jgi:hypothetical protein
MTHYAAGGGAYTSPTKARTDLAAALPLHAQLYLLAHDDDTGKPHLNEQSLAIGLSGALLLELWLARRLYIGWVYDHTARQWQPAPGRLVIAKTNPALNPLLDSALAAVTHTVRAHPDGDQLRTWLRGFADTDVGGRVRASMIITGLLRRTQLRRMAGLVRTETYLAVHERYPARVRAHIRDAIAYHQRRGGYRPSAPDDQTVALCGLTAALELAEFVYISLPNRELTGWLRHVVDQHDADTIPAVITAVDAARGDLAVAAMP